MLHTSRRHVHTHANYRKHTHTRIKHTHVCVCVFGCRHGNSSRAGLEGLARARDLCTDATNYSSGATVTATVSPSSCLSFSPSLSLSLWLSLSVCAPRLMCVVCSMHACLCVSSSSSASKPIFGFERSSKTVSNEIYALRPKDGSENEHIRVLCVRVRVWVWVCTCVCAPLIRDNWLYLPTVAAQVFESSLALALPLRVAYFMAFPSLIRRQQQYFISNCWQSFLIKYDRLPDLVCGPPNWISLDAAVAATAAHETESCPSWRCQSCKALAKLLDIGLKELLKN